ncbi:Fc.00g013400.m01.CDS01 [Cosmosporella sp. VM-42]
MPTLSWDYGGLTPNAATDIHLRVREGQAEEQDQTNLSNGRHSKYHEDQEHPQRTESGWRAKTEAEDGDDELGDSSSMGTSPRLKKHEDDIDGLADESPLRRKRRTTSLQTKPGKARKKPVVKPKQSDEKKGRKDNADNRDGDFNDEPRRHSRRHQLATDVYRKPGISHHKQPEQNPRGPDLCPGAHAFKQLRKLRKLKLTIRHPNRRDNGKLYNVDDFTFDENCGPEGANAKACTFDYEGQSVSVQDYYKKRYKATLKYANLPLIKAGKNGIVFAWIEPMQRYLFKLNPDQTTDMI